MKKIVLSIMFTLSSFYVFSQGLPTFQLGIKGGMNLAKFKTENTFDSDNKGGYYGGIWARIGGAGIFLQPELYLSGKNSNLVTVTGQTQTNSVKFTSLDLPVLVGTKIGAAGFGVRLNTGPVFTFMLNEQQDFPQAASAAFKGKFKDATLAWQAGVGLDIGKLNIDGRYEYGLSEINSAAGYPTTKLNLFTIGVGFRIF
ncbi:porin family protein [Pedobacter sp. Du54]|uniref:porin family protein n=1 Tax=Pedobacter anseongensis TaxID=3133439 RepID=UPI0030A88471